MYTYLWPFYSHTHTHTHTHTRTHIHSHTPMCSHTYTRAHTCTHTHIHTFKTCTHVHTHLLTGKQYIVDSLQSVLEVAEAPALLEAVVKNITSIAKFCPQHFGHHFNVSITSLYTYLSNSLMMPPFKFVIFFGQLYKLLISHADMSMKYTCIL